MSIEYEIANDPKDEGDGKGYKFLVKGFDPALPAEHDAGSAHGKSVPLYITKTGATRAKRDALLKVQMDKVPVISAALAEIKDGDGNVTSPALPEVLGMSPRQVIAAWIAKQIGKPAVKMAVLPTKDVPRTITEKDEDGKEVSREIMEKVTDRKVAL